MAKRYEWDERKNRSNRAEHGFTFEVAAKVFLDPNALELQDREVDGEQRWQTIGYAGAILTVAHTIRDEGIDEVIRIISARKATLSERRIYEESEDLN
ncbi:MAG: BrnT family toxin [Bryobacteraceae bacterium]